MRDLGVAAISVDPPAAGGRLAGKLGLAFPLVSDPSHAAIAAFGVFDDQTEIAWPAVFVIGKDGVVQQRWLADTFRERIATPDVLRALTDAR